MRNNKRASFLGTCLVMGLLHAIFGNDRNMRWIWCPWGFGPW